jgi:2'-5' RNA ligase
MRLFTGLDLPGEVEARLDRLLHELRPTADITWSPIANLHITTKFIGEWPEARVPELITKLKDSVPKPGVLSIAVRGVGWFPNPHQPRVLFAAIQAPQGLLDLAASTDRATAELGVAPEDRKYSPHLTLAKIKGSHSLAPLRQAIARPESLDFGTFDAEAFYLYKSVPGPRGSVYTKLSEFPLA